MLIRCLLFLCMLLAGCRCNRSSRPVRPHVLLISIDTLRADFLGTYGNQWISTPNIDALAASGVVFEDHVAAAPTTLSSHTSLFTGTWPHTHGVPRNGFLVPEENLMLPEVLHDAGYQTAGFIGGYPLVRPYAFNQGFDYYETRFDPTSPGLKVYGSQRSAQGLTDGVIHWLKKRQTETPLFLFVHYFDVHAPYMAPEPYYGMYRRDDSDVTGTVDDTFRVKDALRKHPLQARRESLALTSLYAGEVSYVDAQVGRLIQWLRETGMLENTLVILTSDHGETMHEHPMIEAWDHGYGVYRTTQHIPLIIRHPYLSGGKREPALMSNIDVAPTLLDLLKVPIPSRMEGVSYAGAVTGAPFTPRLHAYAEATKPGADDYEDGHRWRGELKPKMVRTSSSKLMLHPKRNAWRFYDLVADPKEKRDVHAKTPVPVLEPLERALDKWIESADPLDAQKDVDEKNREMLNALGYFEGSDAPQSP